MAGIDERMDSPLAWRQLVPPCRILAVKHADSHAPAVSPVGSLSCAAIASVAHARVASIAIMYILCLSEHDATACLCLRIE